MADSTKKPALLDKLTSDVKRVSTMVQPIQSIVSIVLLFTWFYGINVDGYTQPGLDGGVTAVNPSTLKVNAFVVCVESPTGETCDRHSKICQKSIERAGEEPIVPCIIPYEDFTYTNDTHTFEARGFSFTIADAGQREVVERWVDSPVPVLGNIDLVFSLVFINYVWSQLTKLERLDGGDFRERNSRAVAWNLTVLIFVLIYGMLGNQDGWTRFGISAAVSVFIILPAGYFDKFPTFYRVSLWRENALIADLYHYVQCLFGVVQLVLVLLWASYYNHVGFDAQNHYDDILFAYLALIVLSVLLIAETVGTYMARRRPPSRPRRSKRNAMTPAEAAAIRTEFSGEALGPRASMLRNSLNLDV